MDTIISSQLTTLIIQTVSSSSILAVFLIGMHKYWESLGLND